MTADSDGDILRVAEDALRTLRDRPTADVNIDELTRNALAAVSGAEHAGITVACEDGTVHTAAATDQYPNLLDKIQQRHGDGPCLSAAWENHVIRIDDLTTVQRWPGYCRDAVEQTPIRSVMSFQLFASPHTVGALNFFADRPFAFDDDAVETGVIVATHTAMCWQALRRDQQFRSALATRDIIGQAKGIIMERFNVDAVQAFEILKRLSQGSNTKLVEIAHQLIERRRHGDDSG